MITAAVIMVAALVFLTGLTADLALGAA